MKNFLSGRSWPDPDQVERIRRWARSAWDLSDAATVIVTELECTEPGCPPIETLIGLLEGPGRNKQYKIHKRVSDILESDLEALPLQGGEDHHKEKIDEPPHGSGGPGPSQG